EALGILDNSFIPYPSSYSLMVPYPNPFNSATKISYGLPHSDHVSLQVYNTLGQQVSTLFEGYKQPGIHTVNLSAQNLPSGLYFLRLIGSDQVFTQKVMLIK
ncbi:T9SS type A sorting domain-containing protein, partial [Calditrichota bacterium]